MPRAGLDAERLTVAGAELADAGGFAQVTLAALARQVGVRTASLYSHVASTHDLRVRIAQLALDELADRVAGAVAGRSGRDALAAFAGAHRDYARDHPGRWDATRLPLDHATAMAGAGPRHAELSRAVLRGYGLSGDEQTHAVRLLGSVVLGFVTLSSADGFAHSTPDAETTWRRVVDVLDAALLAWPDPGDPR